MTSGPNGRVAIVDGCRTPFQKAGSGFSALSSLDLASHAVGSLAARNGMDGDDITSVVLGSVYVPQAVPYLARQVALRLGWESTDGHSTECACATGARSTVTGAYQILSGEHDVVITGGAESLSQRPVEASPAARAAAPSGRPGREGAELAALLSVTLSDLVPPAPDVTEPYSGRTLLDHAEDMMRAWDVTRAQADEFAVESHRRAAAAWREGRIGPDVCPVELPEGQTIASDGVLRPETTLEAAAKLTTIRPDGLITAANASALTDGASAVLLMSERAAEQRGHEPRAFLRSWSFTSHAPDLGALIGPVFALSEALGRASIGLDDLDLLDLHEAFAGQVLVNLVAMESEEFAVAHLPGRAPLGKVPVDRLNVNGGSVALGHPFGATGGRILTQTVDELVRRRARTAAIAICAGGARGAALVLEAA